MGKKHSPRHGSLAYLPRGRARSMIPIVKTWPKNVGEKPMLLGSAGFKAGTMHVYTIDDRERTPNFGKPLFNTATVLESPPVFISGFRAYEYHEEALSVINEVYAKKQPKDVDRKKKFKNTSTKETLESIKKSLSRVERFTAVCCVTPRETGMSQKIPIIFEVEVGGGIIDSQFEYLQTILGKTIKISEVFQPGMNIDTIGVTKGKGFEGPVTRMGIKRKQHKSRKTVRAVGSIGPWKPTATMYTIPSAGQRGLHRRTEYNKRVLLVNTTDETPITPKGGFKHYGEVKSDYIILRGSIQGPPKRFVKFRYGIRLGNRKTRPPKILKISTINTGDN
ncbi:50S ribosomal protein L3 [Thermoproteota archaeon]